MSTETSVAPSRYEMLPRILSLTGVVLVYWAIQQVSSYGYLTHAVALHPSLSSAAFLLLEQKIWEFLIGMTVIAVMSRGHLWSFGINSMDVRFSMRMLVRFYAAATVFVIGMVLIPLMRGAAMPVIYAHISISTMGVWLLVQWMASPIADTVLFFGVFQTILSKYWTEVLEFKQFRLPVGGVYAAMAFVVGRIRIPVFGSDMLEYATAAVVGLFCAWVYDRTRSLLTPMLALAFLYGLPFVIRFAWTLL